MEIVKATLIKADGAWQVILKWSDGETCNDYRFPTHSAAMAWAARVGVTLED